MKTKATASILISRLILVSCGDKNTYISPTSTLIKNKSDTLEKNENKLFLESWKKLVLNKDKNSFALAKVFSSHVSISERESVERYIAENLSSEEVYKVIEDVGKNYDKKRIEFL